ncbi:adenylosuccinate synthase [Botrimarina hoheduenensis]|uniref:Adenylosuccinate synthetase n=1 Tax=Botrimarina hoheduenensis TaxID=2528000 RepID=A0A5C5WAH3_9BACT|nr:adenylosuccinate synthase [Botrimarina hoheduenensis]TWT47313.1 Adenylosuccinate synthetase [Botrimarina hoheduenensis]
MPGTCVIGLQWGDEAKGKIVDILTPQHDFVVRYQGGANAGHTVVVGKEVYKLSLLPSGVLTEGVTSVIAGGVVVNPAKAIEELDELASRGVQGLEQNLKISDRAHVILPWHFAEDRALDGAVKGDESIGTTQRGIGPCYRDKVARSHAVRFGDLYRDDLRSRIEHIVAAKTPVLRAMSPAESEPPPLDAAAIYEQYRAFAERLRPHVCDTTELLLTAAEAGKRILFEGAQGALLDVDHGTYPYVTSSNSSGVGVASGSGVPSKYVGHMIGVVKAYSTRVGGGPFPTEQDNAYGQQLRDQGNEYGTVTRRPRRCGWLDAVAVRYTARLGGVDSIAVMLLDVLSGVKDLQICTAYEIDGHRTNAFPSHVDELRRVKPIYETVEGWSEDLTACRSMEDFPPAALAYLKRVSELVERPVSLVSVGPGRDQTILLGELAPLAATT